MEGRRGRDSTITGSDGLEYVNVKIERKGDIAILRVNRPQVLNALNADTVKELILAVEELEADMSVKAVIFTGEGKSFIAGADIKQMSELTPMQARAFAEGGHGLLERIERSRLPYIAAVNGYALGGGCEVLMACDMVIASSKALIGQPEINLGISPGFGGTQRLPRHVGKMKAKELMLTGDNITADEALRIGLVNKVVAPEALMLEAEALAAKITSKSPIQVAFIKALVNKGSEVDLVTANALEIAYFSSSFSTEDQKEGMKAFIEKRKAVFKGK